MAEELTLRIITPESIPLDTTASSVQIPAVDGLMGILRGHARMVAALASGVMIYRDATGQHRLFVGGGFCEVRDNTVRIVTEVGEKEEEIDVERARAAEARARERLTEGRSHPGSSIDVARAERALRRALVRLRIKDRPL